MKKPKSGANCAIFLNLGEIKGIFGNVVQKIQAPARLFMKCFLMGLLKVYLLK